MKEIIEFVKKLWSNKRTRALAILIIYVIFFTFVFLLISSGSKVYKESIKDETNIDENKEIKLEDITDYKLEIIGEDNFIYESITNKIFYDGIYYEIENRPENLIKYDINIFSPINISNLLKVSILESTNYIAKSNTYIIKISDFEKISNNIEVINDEYIKIIKYEEKIIIDLTNYYGYVANIELRS